MRPKLLTLALALAALAAGACAWSDQRVQLRPTIPFARSDLAGGRAIDLRVTDERPRTVIGHRIGPGVGGAITADPDLSALARDRLADALRRYGFTIAEPAAAEAAILDVALRNFDYEVVREGISISVHTWAALAASCRSAGREYDRFYREHGVRAGRSFRLPPESNAVLLNETFSGVLRMPLADRDLLDCLVGSKRTDRSDQTP